MKIETEVAVVGAGPAGSIASRALAAAGIETVLVDRFAFPRDKVCGDALLPDAVAALSEAGLLERVRAAALSISRAIFRAPGGVPVEVGGRFLTLRREHLDALLLDGAVEAGARFVPGLTAKRPIEERGVVVGLSGTLPDGRPAAVRARVVVLAAGSSPRLLSSFGVLTRPSASAVAIRGYLSRVPFPECRGANPPLLVSYERALLPGYGWAFPLPGGEWNVGCGLFYDARTPRRGLLRLARSRPASADGGDLRPLLAAFLASPPDVAAASPGAREDPPLRVSRPGGRRAAERPRPVRSGEVRSGGSGVGAPLEIPVDAAWWRSLRGATLRTGFGGARAVSGSVLVAGESLGLTLPLTGDGIGKAMQSGLLAARTIADALRSRAGAVDLSSYPERLEETMRSTYDAYGAAQRWMRVPAVPDLIVRRAARSAPLRRLIEEIVAETANPRELLSVLGILRAVLA